MKKTILFLAIAFLPLASCKKETIAGIGPVETQQRNHRNFSKIFARGASKVFITKGDQFKVSVKAYSSLLPYLETEVTGGVLNISYKDDTRIRNDNSEIFITMPALSGITSEGSGDVSVAGDYSGHTAFDIRISGSSNVSLENGAARIFNGTIEGSGNIRAFGFLAEEVAIKVSGSGNTEISVSQKLDVKINGSGNVYYKGNPALVKSDIKGSGRVIRQ